MARVDTTGLARYFRQTGHFSAEERLFLSSLSAVSEAPTSEDLSFRCAVKGRFRYSDLKEAAPGDYGICIWMSWS
jgi:hypothetical protein